MKRTNIEHRLFLALDKLAHSSEDLLHVLAERMTWDGGIERLFQAALLWAFNSLEERPYYYMGAELNSMDCMVFKSDPETNQKVELDLDQTDNRWYDLACGYIEIKDIDNIADLPRDLMKLRRAGQMAHRDKVESRFLYEIVLLKTWHRTPAARDWQETLERKCWREFYSQGVKEDGCRIGMKVLFEDKHSASSSHIHTYLAALVVSIPPDPLPDLKTVPTLRIKKR
jgi:hypothetical protein